MARAAGACRRRHRRTLARRGDLPLRLRHEGVRHSGRRAHQAAQGPRLGAAAGTQAGRLLAYLRSDHERAAYARVFYPGTDVYVNKLSIRDAARLAAVERELTAERAEQGFPRTAHFRSYDGFRAIHRHLFRDLYAWACKERKYTTGRGSIPFAVPEHIDPWMQQQFDALAREDCLASVGPDAFADAAARYVNEINAAHPFIDGNGRAQRFWLRMLADNAGFELTLRDSDGKRWNQASRTGFMRSDHAPMVTLLRKRLRER